MPSYKYVGCITAFSEGDNSQMLMPTAENQTPINRPDTPYSERLLQRSLLIAEKTPIDDPIVDDPMVCIPSGIEINNTALADSAVNYYLTLSANDLPHETLSFAGGGKTLVSRLIKSAIAQYGFNNNLSIVADGGGGDFWIVTPLNQFWPDFLTIHFGGVSKSFVPIVETTENHLTIVPTPVEKMETDGIDLYQYIIDAPSDKVEIFSCAVATQMGV